MGKGVRDPSAIKSKVTQQTRVRASLHSGLRLEAGSPAPSSPGQDRTREASPLADAAHAHSAGPRALHRGAHRTAAVVCCHGRRTPATSGAARHCSQSARAALAGGTGGQRAHAPSPVPASLAAALALTHPHRHPAGEGRSAPWNVPGHLAKPTVPSTTDARGPPGFLERLPGCTSAPQQLLCAPLPFPWAGKLATPVLFPWERAEAPYTHTHLHVCANSPPSRVCQPRPLDLGRACHLLGARRDRDLH